MIQEDIDKGVPGDPKRCPLSNMFNRYFPTTENEFGFNVMKMTKYNDKGEVEEVSYDKITEPVIISYMKRFDAGEKVEFLNISAYFDDPENTATPQEVTR